MNERQAVTILSRRFPAKRAFITGAASGLGRALATELAAAGWHLGLLDLSATRLAETMPAADWRWITEINLLGVVWGCQAAAQCMRAAGWC